MSWSSGLSFLPTPNHIPVQVGSSNPSPPATYNSLMKSVVSESFGSSGKGKMAAVGETALDLQVEDGQRQSSFKGL